MHIIEKSKHIKTTRKMLIFIAVFAGILGIIVFLTRQKSADLAMFLTGIFTLLIAFSVVIIVREFIRIKNLYTYGKEYKGVITVKSPVSDDGGSTYIFEYEENGEYKSCQINTGYMTSDMDKKEVIALIYKKAACIKAVKY